MSTTPSWLSGVGTVVSHDLWFSSLKVTLQISSPTWWKQSAKHVRINYAASDILDSESRINYVQDYAIRL